MTEYQLLHLRFRNMERDYPCLNHAGHGPTPTSENTGIDESSLIAKFGDLAWIVANAISRDQANQVDREFERSVA